MNLYNILHISYSDWKSSYAIPEALNWFQVSPNNILAFSSQLNHAHTYDFVLVDAISEFDYLLFLDSYIPPHRLIVSQQNFPVNPTLEKFLFQKQALSMDFSDPDSIIKQLTHALATPNFKQILKPNSLHLQTSSSIKVEWINSEQMSLTGKFGDDFIPIGSYRAPMSLFTHQILEFWPKHDLTPQLQLRYSFSFYQKIDGRLLLVDEQSYTFCKSETQPIHLDITKSPLILVISLSIKGEGKVTLGELRLRKDYGLLGFDQIGGKRLIVQNKDEIAYYFNPGKQAHSLTVFFSNSQSKNHLVLPQFLADSAEAYLIIADMRSHSGHFYIGNQDYENTLIQLIVSCTEKLSLSLEKCIFSGIEMGSFAALYYAARLQPSFVLVGNPIVNLGTLAVQETTLHPQKLSTILDTFRMFFKEYSYDQANHFNDYFWDAFTANRWEKTKFAIASIETEVADAESYHDLCDYLSGLDTSPLLHAKNFSSPQHESSILNQWMVEQYHLIVTKMRKEKTDET